MDVRAKILILFYFLSAVPLLSVAQSVPYQIISFDEDLSIKVSVSGTVMASYLVSGELTHVSADSLYIYVVPEKRKLHASLVSIDGKYAAEFELFHSSVEAGWINVQFPTKFRQDLKNYAADELVAYIFSDGQDKFGYYIQEVFPSSWGAPKMDKRKILINSAGFVPEYSYRNKDYETIVGNCKEIVNKIARAFNYSCDFSVKNTEQPVLIIINTTPDGAGKKFMLWSDD